MVTVPALSGAALAGFAPLHLPLLLLWWVGYFAFQAMALWLKSHRRAKYFPPVRAYTLAAAPFAVAVLAMRPALAWWALAFAPLVGIAVWAAWTRNERGMLNDLATVLAACLMIPVAFSAAAPLTDPAWPWVWTVTAVELAYFWGTIPHVKALIRERGNPAFARLTVGYHAACAAVVGVAAALGWLAEAPLGGWPLVAVWLALTARTAWMTGRQRVAGPFRPAVIGFTEVVFSLLVPAALLL